jgi:processive 1,2-diacylglycerol beta-glucosyltransferase
MNSRFAENAEHDNPVLILTISNGAGHIRVAEGIAAAIRAVQPSVPVMIADVADYMKAFVRFTHITAYLWIVKHAPSAWDRIDRYQKRQPHTSPEWFYRRGCLPLFELARRVRPRAIVATEVGCCEIAALIKRDLGLNVPLVGVNDDYDADRAWVQPEVDLYCFVANEFGEELIAHGAPRERVAIWGAPLPVGYDVSRRREEVRAEVCRRLNLDPNLPLVLIAGGGEGMGQIEETTRRLLQLHKPALQLVVLSGRNQRLKSRCERLSQNASRGNCRVLGWTEPEQMAQLMYAADLMVSKLGGMFNEAIASELPIIAMEPPPGSERVQYRLLEKWKLGCAVQTLDQVVEQVSYLLAQPQVLAEMQAQSRTHYRPGVSQRIARWVCSAAAEEESAQFDSEKYTAAFA